MVFQASPIFCCISSAYRKIPISSLYIFSYPCYTSSPNIGVFTKNPISFYQIEHKDFTFFESISAGINHGWNFLLSYIKQFRVIFTKEGAQSVGGFGAISNMFPESWNWHSFWNTTAILSLVLAFMNFLPIPALDGGYILFLIWEIITRRKPSDKFLEIANTIGFWLLLALMIFANGNDIFKAFF